MQARIHTEVAVAHQPGEKLSRQKENPPSPAGFLLI
jgi:hypothetical protein